MTPEQINIYDRNHAALSLANRCDENANDNGRQARIKALILRSVKWAEIERSSLQSTKLRGTAGDLVWRES